MTILKRIRENEWIKIFRGRNWRRELRAVKKTLLLKYLSFSLRKLDPKNNHKRMLFLDSPKVLNYKKVLQMVVIDSRTIISVHIIL